MLKDDRCFIHVYSCPINFIQISVTVQCMGLVEGKEGLWLRYPENSSGVSGEMVESM